MGASDYMVGDPGRYAVPQVGQQLGQALADLPDAYMKGREQKRVRAMQDMFAGGLPQNEDGSTNWTAALQKYLQEGAKVGGGPFVGQYVPTLLDEEMGRNAAAISRGEPIPPSAFFGPAPGQANGPAGPGNIQMPSQAQGGPQGQPQPPATQPQQSGPRFRQLAASYHLGKDAIDSLGRVLKIDPEMPLSPQQVVAVRRAIEEELPKASTGAQPGRGAPSEVNQPAEGTSAADDAMNGGSRPPFMGGGTSGAPATPGGRAPNAVAQAGPGMATVDNAGAGGTPGGVPGLRPTPVGTEAEARQQELVASRKEAAAAYLSKRNPTGSKDLMEQAQAARKRASEIRASLGEYNKPTTEQMNAESPAVARSEGLKIAQKHELDAGAALDNGLQRSASEFETQLKPHLDAVRGILNDPNFVSGSGVGFMEALNKIRSNPLFQGLPGYDPNAALPNEAIRKVMAASILNQTTALKAEAAEMGGSAGRLFQQQIQLMIDAAQKPENTASALRYLSELQERMGNHARAMAALASNYEGKYGRGVLDRGFNRVLSEFNSKPENQIFKPKEIADPRLFAPPAAPAGGFNTKEQAVAWARNAGLNPGDPMKMPSGKIVPAP